MQLKPEEIKEIVYFCETGKRFHDIVVTDRWVEESLKKAVDDLIGMKESLDIHIKVSQDLIGIVDAARALHKAWRKDESDLTPLFEALKVAINTHR